VARGDVLALRRAIGFLSGDKLEHFVVVQSDRLQGVLDTVVAVPLDEGRPGYGGLPGIVPVSAREAGTKREQVAIVTHLASLPAERFEAAPVGRLRSTTMSRIGSVVRLILELDGA
jgi:mRNA-degrading endonuclease toxin of MazEF toxin-antitoxin module